MSQPAQDRTETEVAASLSAYFKLRNMPLVSPRLNNNPVTLTKLFVQVQQLGGYKNCNWESCANTILGDVTCSQELKHLYEQHLLSFENATTDPMDEFYSGDTFKVKSYKPFDGNMIYDRCSPFPLKELNQFLISRNYGFATMMHDRLGSMLRPTNDPSKIALLQDLGVIDTLTIIKMLESDIYDEVQQAITIINICALDAQIDFNFVENPEFYNTIFHCFKSQVECLVGCLTGNKKTTNNDFRSWQQNSFMLLELCLMFLRTFSNFCHRKELEPFILKLDLLDVTLNLSMLLLSLFQSWFDIDIIFIINSRNSHAIKTNNKQFQLLPTISDLLNILHLISCIHSQIGNTLVHPMHRMSDIFTLMSFTQLGFRQYLINYNDFNASILLGYLDEIQNNCCFLLGNIFILQENTSQFVLQLSKSQNKPKLQILFEKLSKPLADTNVIGMDTTSTFMVLHCMYRLTTREVLRGMSWDPINVIQGLMDWMLRDAKVQEKSLIMIRHFVQYYKMNKDDNKLMESWDNIQSWLIELIGDSRIVKRKMAISILYLISK
eukprot:NODE_132_length_18298_cov_0.443101.p2 type:complete len:551 gc:universal NODE_132_length_18298_cov_0.443101:4958-3306(-)